MRFNINFKQCKKGKQKKTRNLKKLNLSELKLKSGTLN